jgi:hypothetical protein
MKSIQNISSLLLIPTTLLVLVSTTDAAGILFPSCNLCGVGGVMERPDYRVEFGRYVSIRCATLDRRLKLGVTRFRCSRMQTNEYFYSICGCNLSEKDKN